MTRRPKGPFVLGAAATIGTGATAGRVVVVGSSNWMANQILSAPVANRDLVLNMMNWLTSDEDLISIRPKEPEDRRLRVTGSAMRVIFLTSVIFLPLIVILSGVSTGGNGDSGSMMKPTGLLSATGVLLVLGGLVWWTSKHPKAGYAGHSRRS